MVNNKVEERMVKIEVDKFDASYCEVNEQTSAVIF